jgi:hypothetical protein
MENLASLNFPQICRGELLLSAYVMCNLGWLAHSIKTFQNTEIYGKRVRFSRSAGFHFVRGAEQRFNGYARLIHYTQILLRKTLLNAIVCMLTVLINPWFQNSWHNLISLSENVL